MKLQGVFVANITPFTAAGELDLPALRKLYERLALEGVAGFVPCGTTGEGPVLTPEERRQVIGLAVEYARKHSLQVIAGCNSNVTQIVLEQMKEAKELGCNAALVVTPYYNKPTQAGLIAHYQKLADANLLPIVLYNVPGRTAVNLAFETVSKLFEHPQIVGLKEASGNYSQWIQLSHGLNLENKFLLAGDDDAFTPLLALGGSGIISASANVTAKPFVQIHSLFKKGDWKEAFQLQKNILPLVQAVFCETNPAPIKYALSRLGQAAETLRLPLVPISPPSQEKMEATLKALNLISGELP